MRLSICLALGGLALAAQAAGAQNACSDMKSFFSQPPRLGDWAELKMDMKKGKQPIVSRIGFVGKEERSGRELYRMQMIMTQDGKQHIMQVLTPWDIGAMSDDYDTEVIMKIGGQPAMVMPFKAGKDQPGMYDLRKECAKIKYVGEESVEVPAGTFKARHYTGPDGDTWVSPQVPGWRMVKMVTKEGDSMVLTATGTGAKNEITETPVDMKSMMGGGAMKRMMEQNKEEDDK